MIRFYKEIWDGDPVLRRLYQDLWARGMVWLQGQPIVELGGGGGFIRECYPDVIASDLLPYPWTSLLCDATRLPFRDASVSGYISVAFFHHCPSPWRLFQEIDRTLKPGGRMVILDPAATPFFRLVRPLSTPESLGLSEFPFERDELVQEHPLLEANVARATLVFERYVDIFKREFPRLEILSTETTNCFTHFVAGSFNQKSPFPAWCYPVAQWADRLLHPVRRWTGLLMTIVLQKA